VIKKGAPLLPIDAAKYQNILVVGDDDQAIYGWRGADIANLKKLPDEFPRLKVIKLEQKEDIFQVFV
jgi:superfamily I DNA/RNA helicase